MLVKGCFIKRRRFRTEQLVLAVAAIRRGGQLAGLHPVGGVAVRTDDVQGSGHPLQLGPGEVISSVLTFHSAQGEQHFVGDTLQTVGSFSHWKLFRKP
jgi:hypothetical protein